MGQLARVTFASCGTTVIGICTPTSTSTYARGIADRLKGQLSCNCARARGRIRILDAT